jgi:hypothetical protein
MIRPSAGFATRLRQVIHQELDRLRSHDWTLRPPTVESTLGPLTCNYEDTVGSTSWVCLNGQVQVPGEEPPRSTGTRTSATHNVRIWIPQPRRS